MTSTRHLPDRLCNNCGQEFRYPAGLRRHLQNKKPCGTTIVPNDANFPCMYCKRSYKHKHSLVRHYKSCKVKNADKKTILDKLKQEHETRLKYEKTISDMQAGFNKMVAKFDSLEAKIQESKTSTTVNSNNNSNNNITINNYKTPDISDLNVDLSTLTNSKLIKSIMEAIYFNPDKPENHCILSQNIQQKRVAVYDNGWKLLTSERELERLIDAVKATCLKEGDNLIKSCDQQDLTPVQTNKIQSFNGLEHEGEACITDDEVLKVFHKHKDMVTNTKKHGK
jgi:hypothetical protein